MKRKIVLLLFAAIFTLSVSAQTESPAATGETAADGKPDPVPEEKTEVIAPVEIDETLSVEPQEEFLFSEFQKQEKETVESLQKALAANTKSFTMYKAFQYTSVTVAGTIRGANTRLHRFRRTTIPIRRLLRRHSEISALPEPLSPLSERELQSAFSFRTGNTATSNTFLKKKSGICRNGKRRRPDWKI